MEKYVLQSIIPQKNGAAAKINIEIISEADTVKKTFTVSSDMLFSLDIAQSGLCEISEEKYIDIEYSAQVYNAAVLAAKMLAMSDNTAKMLQKKLRMRGIDKDIAQSAVEYLRSIGILKENVMAQNFFYNLANTKLYGPLRIKREMYQKGFSDEAIRDAENLCETDFVAICQKRIRHMRISFPFSSPQEKQKTIQSLMRYGFLYEDIKSAFATLCEK